MIRIYQISTPRECKYAYMSYDYAKSMLKMEDYKLVAEYEVPVKDVQDTLNKVWDEGNNGELQSRFPGMHSVSVSDIIEVDNIKYYTDTFGFKEVQ